MYNMYDFEGVILELRDYLITRGDNKTMQKLIDILKEEKQRVGILEIELMDMLNEEEYTRKLEEEKLVEERKNYLYCQESYSIYGQQNEGMN